MTLREYYYAFLRRIGLDRYCPTPRKPLSETDRAILAKFLEDARKPMMLSKFGMEEMLPHLGPGRTIIFERRGPLLDDAKEEHDVEKLFHYHKNRRISHE